MKYLSFLFLTVLRLKASVVCSQSLRCEYYLDTLSKEKPRMVYGFFDGDHNDTMVDCGSIQVFEIKNPSAYKNEIKWLSKMQHLQELRLLGDDTDSLDKFRRKQFRMMCNSKDLKWIFMCSIDDTAALEKYIHKKSLRIKLQNCGG